LKIPVKRLLISPSSVVGQGPALTKPVSSLSRSLDPDFSRA